jgi:hypothetical protein
MDDAVKVFIPRGLGLKDITFLKMGAHIGSRFIA